MENNSLAGKLIELSMLVDIPKLITAYYSLVPDVSISEQKVMFGTSGHRGCAFDYTFNELHILSISQAICNYRLLQKIDGPLFLGFDTHALSYPAYASALEVFAANNIIVMIAENDEYTPTPVISHAIINYNRNRKNGFADGVVITPSHNPPQDGGFKYNPPNGGPSSSIVSDWIQKEANKILINRKLKIKRIPFEKAIHVSTIHRFNYIENYINELKSVINTDVIRDSKISIGVDPLGGAGVNYWEPIAQKYGLNLTVVNKIVDPTFRFVPLDWDGQIRMDPSSEYAMQGLIKIKDKFDISFACDTDHDRHGIVTRSNGLLPPNHYISAAIYYLLKHRKNWNNSFSIGKTIVTSSLLDKITLRLGRKVYETPVGFKWFAEGLINGSLCFSGEESAGASFVRIDGSPWTTDKDGIIPSLLAAEMTVVSGRDPSEIYQNLTNEFGQPYYERVEASATNEQKKIIKNLSPKQITSKELAGEKIEKILNKATGNKESIGGIKVITKNGWFAARPSGTEDIYKIYGESFKSEIHLNKILQEAQEVIDKALTE